MHSFILCTILYTLCVMVIKRLLLIMFRALTTNLKHNFAFLNFFCVIQVFIKDTQDPLFLTFACKSNVYYVQRYHFSYWYLEPFFPNYLYQYNPQACVGYYYWMLMCQILCKQKVIVTFWKGCSMAKIFKVSWMQPYNKNILSHLVHYSKVN